MQLKRVVWGALLFLSLGALPLGVGCGSADERSGGEGGAGGEELPMPPPVGRGGAGGSGATGGGGGAGGKGGTGGDPGTTGAKVESLTVSGVRIDSQTFQEEGEFALGLLALDANEAPILKGGKIEVTLVVEDPEQGENACDNCEGGCEICWEVCEACATYGGWGGGDWWGIDDDQQTSYTILIEGTEVEQPNDEPIYAAILLDDSGSMEESDADYLRADAALVFWEEILAVRPDNQVALLDFGVSTPSWEVELYYTRLIQDWTRDEDVLEDSLSLITAYGSTPLYESLTETCAWMDATTPETSNRAILLLSDGEPTNPYAKEDGIDAAREIGARVHTVGLGPASDLDSKMSPLAVDAVRDVAKGTSGVYAAASSAEALRPIFRTLAQVTGLGQMVTTFRILPSPPPSGVRVSGTVTFTSGGVSQTANWSFIAP